MSRLSILVCLAFVLPTATFAQDRTFGAWKVTLSKDFGESFTRNDSGSSFGLLCTEQSCRFYLDAGLGCEPDGKYGGMLNSESGANHVSLSCLKIGTTHVYTFDDMSAVQLALKSGDQIGFALPLKSGQFKAVRFKIDGALNAIDHLTTEMVNRAAKKTKDQVL